MKKRIPIFSVVAPTLNGGPKCCAPSGASLRNRFEILVIDDGTDGCATLLRQAFAVGVKYLGGSRRGVPSVERKRTSDAVRAVA